MKSRIRHVALGGTLLLTILGARLYDLQVTNGERYVQKARRNSLVSEARSATRGRILDRRGELLVSNAPQFELVVTPSALRSKKETLPVLSTLLDEPLEELEKKISLASPHSALVLRRDLKEGVLAKATAIAERHAGVRVRSGAIRRYRYGKMASHLLGYVGEINAAELRSRRGKDYALGDPIGKRGLEKQYDGVLRGVKGTDQVHIDVLGRTVSNFQVRPASHGPDLYLNLDAPLQLEAEKALGEALARLEKKNGERSGGTVVVMDVNTGAVRALASLPQYDPRPFARGIKSKEYQALLDDPGYPLLNRMIHSSFSPGSTFKMITATAALQAALCNPSSTFFCGGNFGPANCFVRSGHGGINFEDSMAHSCDVVYYKLGHEMGIDHLRKYCALYGLGTPTGIDLPAETGGLLPSPVWKKKVWEERWFDGDTVNMSIGQGFLLVSPLQMAVVTAAVANGGYVVRPTIAKKAIARSGSVRLEPKSQKIKLDVNPEFLASIRRGMRGAVTHGTSTSTNLAQVKISGKTGTVENSPSVHNRHGRNHVWFVSFAPYDNPEVTVVVFLEKSHGYGGSLAAPIARKVYQHLYPVKSQKPEEVTQKLL